MIAGCVPYRIEAELQGENVPPNLLHLEEELKKIGYCCKTSLKDLQDGKAFVSQIEPSSFRASHVRNNEDTGFFELVVYYGDKRLDQFAKKYVPRPFSNSS